MLTYYTIAVLFIIILNYYHVYALHAIIVSDDEYGEGYSHTE